MFVCLLTAFLGVGIENNLTVATTLGLLFTRFSWSLKYFIVPRISCEGVQVSSWSTEGQKWPSGPAAARCFVALLMLSGRCQMPLHVIIWGKCKSTQLLRALQRKADGYCPFPERRQQGGFWNVPERGLVPGHLEDCGTSWNRKKACCIQCYSFTSFYMRFFLPSTVASPCCPTQGDQRWESLGWWQKCSEMAGLLVE